MKNVIRLLIAMLLVAVCVVACNRGVYVSVGNHPRNMEIIVDSLDYVRIRVSSDSIR